MTSPLRPDLAALLATQIENRKRRIARRQRKADATAARRGFRHPAADAVIAHEKQLLADLRTLGEALAAATARADRAEARVKAVNTGLREFAEACDAYAASDRDDNPAWDELEARMDRAIDQMDALIAAEEAP